MTGTHVYLEFYNIFARQHIPRMLYQIHFRLNRSPLRRMHKGISAPFLDKRLIYPSVNHVSGDHPNISTPVWYNRDIGNNEAQQRAVLMVLRAPRDSVPLLIHGPYVLLTQFYIVSHALDRHLVPGQGKRLRWWKVFSNVFRSIRILGSSSALRVTPRPT